MELFKNYSVIDLDNYFFEVLRNKKVNFVSEEVDMVFQHYFFPSLDFISQSEQFLFNVSTYKSALDPENIVNNL